MASYSELSKIADDSIIERFESKFLKNSANGCWEWLASKTASGYGKFRYVGKICKSHRISWLVYRGAIPLGDGHHGTRVCHKCDNRTCVNPDHLFLGTIGDNNRDAIKKGRWAKTRRVLFRSKHSETTKERIRKLKTPQRNEIRKLRSSGVSIGELADSFGVTRKTIYTVVRNG